jgi:hypothetical protein
MPTARRFLTALLLLLASGALSGCTMMRNWFGPRDPFAANAPCAFPPEASAAEVIAHLNANTARIGAWRSDHVKISGRGDAQTPVTVSARLAIESPRSFRLTAESPLGEPEVDLGSNQSEFWFWSRRSEQKYMFVAYHDQESIDKRNFPIPFQPDWIMEVFGVMPIDAENVTAQPGPYGSRTVLLIADRLSPQGRPVRKITKVDACHGIVLEHALYDEQGQLIASARMSHPVRDLRTQAVLPSQIDLDWPNAKMGLTMWIQHPEVNPRHIPEKVWQRPEKEGYEVYDLNRGPPQAATGTARRATPGR